MKSAIACAMLLMLAGSAWAELPSASDAAVARALASGKPTVIDLGSKTCIPCKEMAPILESMASEYKDRANILFIDVNQNERAAARFRVQAIPTQVFINSNGTVVQRHMGFLDKNGLVVGLKAAGLK